MKLLFEVRKLGKRLGIKIAVLGQDPQARPSGFYLNLMIRTVPAFIDIIAKNIEISR